jgi:glycosyltransferase involved in cell wall biosynthesis
VSPPDRIDFVIPAHNEEATIAHVVRAVVEAELGPVLVVADSCRDATAMLAHEAGAAVLVTNVANKGGAMHAGVVHSSADRIGFIDGDLTGLQPEHLHLLATYPDAMVVGTRDSTQRVTRFPSIGGERVLPRRVATAANLLGAGYRAEMRLAASAKRLGVPIVEVALHGLQHHTTLDPGRVIPRWREVWAGYREYQTVGRQRVASATGRRPPYAAGD